MATINFVVNGTKRKSVPIYVRLSAGKGTDLIVKSGLTVNPARWSNETQNVKQRLRTEADDKLVKQLKELYTHIEDEVKSNFGGFTKDWLTQVIYKHHNKKSVDAKTLNDYITQFICDAEDGTRKNNSAMNIAPGSIRVLRGFKAVFSEYQGIYTDKRIQWHKKNNKLLRPLKRIDFTDINIDFYNSFVRYLSDEGYAKNTMGRFVKTLKMFMKKSLDDKLHHNREFEHSAFRGFTDQSFSVYLTKDEIDRLYNLDLSKNPGFDKVRDAFLTLCETALRISDYQKVDISIRGNGVKLIYINQKKTGGLVVIPLSARLESILKKYDNQLPKLPDQYINRDIKIICKMAGIDEVLTYPAERYGKKFEKKAHKWELISCHTGRRSAATNMYLAGIPEISIMQITGHKTEKSFLRYIRVTAEENAKLLSAHPYFSGLKAI